MPATRRKRSNRVPVTAALPTPSSSSSFSTHPTAKPKKAASLSSHGTRTLIRRFHVLLKRQKQLQEGKGKGRESEELRAVEKEMEDLGGLKAYQAASALGQSSERGGDSSKVFLVWLREMGEHRRGERGKLRLLEIGALVPDNYAGSTSWIENTPIDLHSRHPSILEQDFLRRPLPSSPDETFDLVSCSLVLNFVPTPLERGQFLRHLHPFLRPSGLLFLVLPLPCILNSRYTTPDAFEQLMRWCGFGKVKERWKEGGKVGYWLFRRLEEVGDGVGEWGKKTVRDEGGGRNNFAIVLPP